MSIRRRRVRRLRFRSRCVLAERRAGFASSRPAQVRPASFDGQFACWDGALDRAARAGLAREARAAWQLAGGSRKSAKSFWITTSARPRCALEAFAQRVARFHFGADAAAWRAVRGCELWVQARVARPLSLFVSPFCAFCHARDHLCVCV